MVLPTVSTHCCLFKVQLLRKHRLMVQGSFGGFSEHIDRSLGSALRVVSQESLCFGGCESFLFEGSKVIAS